MWHPKITFLSRVTLSVLFAFLLFLSLALIKWTEIKAEWNYNLHAKSQSIQICERIRSGLLPLANMNCNPESWASEYQAVMAEDICAKHDRGQKFELLEDYGCNVNVASIYPDDKVNWAWSYLRPLLLDCILFGAFIFFILTVVAKYLAERSQGWKRLSLVVSFTTSVCFIYSNYSGHFYLNTFECVAKPFLIVFPLALASLLYGKNIYGWIKSGFSFDRNLTQEDEVN